MKKTVLLAICCLLTAPLVTAKPLLKPKSVDAFWPDGEKRTYRFLVDEEERGKYEATLEQGERDGVPVFTLDEKLDLRFIVGDSTRSLRVREQLTIDTWCRFVSSETKVTAEAGEEQIFAAYDSISQTVTFLQTKDETPGRAVSVAGHQYALDNCMISQVELALALRDLVPGETFTLPVTSLQGKYLADFEFVVVGETQTRYGPFTDSVWQVNTVRPTQWSMYIDRMHRLVKLVDDGQKLTAELVRDPFAERQGPQKSLIERIDSLIRRFPIYALYLVVAVVGLIFLGRDSYRRRWSYLVFVAGMLVYPLIFVTLDPLLKWSALHIIAPGLQAGLSIPILNLVPALATGLIQETLKLFPLVVIVRLMPARPRRMALISLGAFVGAGFGFVEACHIIGPLFEARQLTSVTAFERLFSLCFHIATGAALGYGLARERITGMWLAAVGAHTFGAYLVTLVQIKLVGVKALQLILAVYDILLLAGMILLRHAYRAALPKVKKERS